MSFEKNRKNFEEEKSFNKDSGAQEKFSKINSRATKKILKKTLKKFYTNFEALKESEKISENI